MRKVRLTVTKAECRCGYVQPGETFLVEDICPPLCTELWHAAYPYVFALQNGAKLDSGDGKAYAFDVRCPDGGRVCIHGELDVESS